MDVTRTPSYIARGINAGHQATLKLYQITRWETYIVHASPCELYATRQMELLGSPNLISMSQGINSFAATSFQQILVIESSFKLDSCNVM